MIFKIFNKEIVSFHMAEKNKLKNSINILLKIKLFIYLDYILYKYIHYLFHLFLILLLLIQFLLFYHQFFVHIQQYQKFN